MFAIDTGTGRAVGHRENERFAMCSTFKWALVAAVLAMVDRSETALGGPGAAVSSGRSRN